MIGQTRWFDRKFDFDFPIGMFPCILERLRGTPARLEEIARSLPRKILVTKVDNKWSIQEHVGHLFDLDKLHDARIDDFLSGVTVLRPADPDNKTTNEANHNANRIENLLRQFRAGRGGFVKRLDQLDEKEIALVAQHPRLKQPMRVVDMAFFVAEHDDHHLARITEMAKTLKKRS